MAIWVNVHEAKTHLSKLLQRVMNGEEVITTKTGKPVARLLPYQPDPAPRLPGNDASKVVIEANFDDPLPEFEEL